MLAYNACYPPSSSAQSQKSLMGALLLLAALACCFTAPAMAQQSSITVVSFGGTTQRTLEQTLFVPFAQASGIRVVPSEYNGELAKIKSMVDSKSVVWHVVQAEGPEILRYCEEGLFERLDWDAISDTALLMDDAARECGSAVYTWGIALSWDASRLKTAPTGWADFWDTEKFPGKRGLRKRAIYNLEFALMADGVPLSEVYQVLATKAGQDRAFAKLDQLKPHIQWWEAGAQPPQWLAAGDVVMSSAYNARIANAQKEGYQLDLTWNGGMYGMDYWAIPKGAANQQAARDFIAFALRQDIQLEFSEIVPHGPTNLSAIEKLSAEAAHWIPNSTENLKQVLAIGDEFWSDHGEELDARFIAWLAQ
ncbi:ABC transporter substrate-binding protein [Ventosimonas gracilis]|nr:ABC transporter substrate-binding protein [Ventosimonas gracilis]